MPRYRFVDPNTTRVDLSDGDWVEFKNGLTYYEQEQISSALMRSLRAGEDEIGIDWAKHRMLRLESWIADWSFRDRQDKPIRVSRVALTSLDADTAAELNEALDKHIETMDEAKAKKDRASAPVTG